MGTETTIWSGTFPSTFKEGTLPLTRVTSSNLGANGIYDNVTSVDFVSQDAHVAFVMQFGSHLGNWDHEDNIMRAVLATPTYGLACCMSGEPHWFCHHMGLGETIGYSTLLTLNNSALYQTQSNVFTRAVYIALMGDPTLRMESISPPAALNAQTNSETVTLTWNTSSDPVAGYVIYRASSPAGQFVRLNESLCTNSSFSDTQVPPGTYIYMVRAVELMTNPSGTYFDSSESIFVPVMVTGSPAPPTLNIEKQNNLTVLLWTSQPGFSYRVLGSPSALQSSWQDMSGSITATSSVSSWIDTNNVTSQRFYRIASP